MNDVKNWALIASDGRPIFASDGLVNGKAEEVSRLRVVLTDGTQFDVEFFERQAGMVMVRGSGFGQDSELSIVPEARNCFGITGTKRR